MTKIRLLQDFATENESNFANYHTKIDSLAAVNETLSTLSTAEENQNLVNDIFLNTIAKGIYQFNPTQIEQLYSIASQCALAGGSAVYKARSIYSLVSDDFFSDEAICPPLGYNLRQGSALNQNSLGFQIVPNPAQDYIKISVPKEGEYELELWDYLGRKISSNTFSTQNTSIRYNLLGISSGIYRCIISQSGNIQYQQTITIIK